MSEVKCLHLSS